MDNNLKIKYCESRKGLLDKVKGIIIDQLGLEISIEEIDDDSALFGTGLALDSIDALDLVIGVEQVFEIKIGEDELQVFRSVNSLVDYIAERQEGIEVADFEKELQRIEGPCKIEVSAAYKKLRSSGIAYEVKNRIFEFDGSDESLDLISEIVSVDVLDLEPNKIQFSALLNEQGRIIDVLYIFMFEDKFWLISSYDNEESANIILAASTEVREVTEDYRCIVLEGPYVWKALRDIVGFEILGLPYQRFIEADMMGVELPIARLSVTGEYGYRMFCKKSDYDNVWIQLNSDDTDQHFDVIEGGIKDAVMKITAMEMRSPLLGVTVKKEGSLLEQELRWMAGFRKESFVGKSAVDAEVQSVQKRVVAFAMGAYEADVSTLVGAPITFEGRVIGVVESTCFSPGLNLHVGYGSFDIEWGYSGLNGISVEGGSGQIAIVTLSTPAFVPESSKVQMY